jgi:hypothetical protein
MFDPETADTVSYLYKVALVKELGIQGCVNFAIIVKLQTGEEGFRGNL